MICKNCGNVMPDDARFCAECGAPVEEGALYSGASVNPEDTPEKASPRVKPQIEGGIPGDGAGASRPSRNITLGEDGVYRWRYDLNLFTDPTVAALVWKIFFWIITAGIGIMALIDLFKWNTDALLGDLKAYGIAIGVMTALTALGYLLYAAVMGGKYCVEFEMDEKGILHKQTASQAKKAKKLGAVTAAVGAARGSLSTAGAGLAATRTEMKTEFSAVKKVKAYPRRHLIKLNETLSHNQVYAADEDFEFVKGYILEHCKNLKK